MSQGFANIRAVNLKTYKVLEHQHTPEIEETLAQAGARGLELRFVPVSAPLSGRDRALQRSRPKPEQVGVVRSHGLHFAPRTGRASAAESARTGATTSTRLAAWGCCRSRPQRRASAPHR